MTNTEPDNEKSRCLNADEAARAFLIAWLMEFGTSAVNNNNWGSNPVYLRAFEKYGTIMQGNKQLSSGNFLKYVEYPVKGFCLTEAALKFIGEEK